MLDKTPITPKGFEKLEAELKNLKYVERPLVIQSISEARALGDLSENAEYHSAKEKQALIEGRIAYLEGTIGSANVINPKKISSSTITFGATIKVVDTQTNKNQTYTIVGRDETDFGNGLISFESPIARAMIGKKVGDEINFKTPNGERDFEVLTLEYIY